MITAHQVQGYRRPDRQTDSQTDGQLTASSKYGALHNLHCTVTMYSLP